MRAECAVGVEKAVGVRHESRVCAVCGRCGRCGEAVGAACWHVFRHVCGQGYMQQRLSIAVGRMDRLNGWLDG
eukprot:349920-Chlamydomonas_euryale.AAC.5